MDDWFSVDVSDPGSDWWNMEPIQQTWDNSYDYSYDTPTYDYGNYDYSYDTPVYDYTNYDSTAFDPNGGYDTNYDYSYDTPAYDYDNPAFDPGTYESVDGGDYTYNDQGLYGPTPGGGNIDSGVLYGPTPGGGNIDSSGGTYGQPGQTQQPGYGQQPQRPGQQQPSLIDRAIGAVTGTGGGSGGGSGGGGLMDSLLPMLLAGGAGYLLSSLIGSKGSDGNAPGGSIGAFGVNQAALSPTKALNTPGSIMSSSSQPAWGNPGAPSATSLGFNAPGQGALGQLAVGGAGAMPMKTNFQLPMQTQYPQLPAPQGMQSMPQLPIPQASLSAMPTSQFTNPALTTQGTPANLEQFQQAVASTGAMPTPQLIAPMDINNVNFGAPNVAGYTPPTGAPVAPNQINDFLRSLMG